MATLDYADAIISSLRLTERTAAAGGGALIAAGIFGAAAGAAPLLIGAGLGLASYELVGGAFETLAVNQAATTADIAARAKEREAQQFIQRATNSRAVADRFAGAQQAAEQRFRDAQATSAERFQAQQDAFAARDARITAERAERDALFAADRALSEERRFEQQLTLQQNSQEFQRERDADREASIRERDDRISAERAAQRALEFEFRGAVEERKAAETAARLALDRERLDLQAARDAAIQEFRAEARRRQESTLLPLAAYALTPIGRTRAPDPGARGELRGPGCVTWQSAVAAGVLAGVYADPYVGVVATTPRGGTINYGHVTGCAGGFIAGGRPLTIRR